MASVTVRANSSRSTASAAPAGTRAMLGRVHDERVEPAHFFFEEADGIVELVAAERVAADQLGQPIGLVDFGRPNRPHFVDGDGNAARGRLPGRLTTGQAAADDVDWA